MILYSKVSSLPDSDPVSLSEAKAHLEVDTTRWDSLITTLVSVAREIGEAYTGLSFATQERVIKMDRFPLCGEEIIVPYGPVQSIDSFTYLDENGATQTLENGTDFYVDLHSGICRIFSIDEDGERTTWPTDALSRPGCISINYTAGFDDVSGDPFPKAAKQAMLMDIATWFENRQSEIVGQMPHEMSFGSKMLYDTIKVTWNANVDY